VTTTPRGYREQSWRPRLPRTPADLARGPTGRNRPGCPYL